MTPVSGLPAAGPADACDEATFLGSLEELHRNWDGSPDSAVLAQWRRSRLEDVVTHVRAGSRFYRSRARSVDGVWQDGFFTTKADLVAAGLEILSRPLGEASVYYETTGTTGPPTPCPRAAVDVAASNRSITTAWAHLLAERFGGRRPTVAIMGPSELYAFGDVFAAVAGSHGLPHVRLWPDSPRVGLSKAVRLICELGVEIVVCAPSMVLQLARACAGSGIDRRSVGIRAFLVLGELTTPQLRANAESLWPGSVVLPGMYGSQEAMCIAAGWPDGTLRIAESNYLVEVVDPADGTATPDGVGELVVTMLTPGIKPLIRYRTGDLVELGRHEAGGPPGRSITVLGRVKDVLAVPSGQVTAYRLEQAVLDRLTRCTGYHVDIAPHPTGGRPVITVRVQFIDRPAAEAAGAELPGTAQDLQQLTGAHVEVETTDALDERTTQGAVISWKAARVTDRRP